MLILPIKKQYFDMILSGDKKEEYREIKPYYCSRLMNEGFLDRYGLPDLWQGWVLFRNGYSKKSPSFKALNLNRTTVKLKRLTVHRIIEFSGYQR